MPRNARHGLSSKQRNQSKSKDRVKIEKNTMASTKKTEDEKFSIRVEVASSKGPSNAKKVLVSKWVDYSSKYGIGAKLSNGCYAVLFNDSTKIVLHPNGFNFVYI